MSGTCHGPIPLERDVAAASMPSDYGLHEPPRWSRTLMRFCHRLPDNPAGRRLAFVLRKLVLHRGRAIYDVEVLGSRWRLYPHENLSDKRLLCTPWMLDGRERSFLVGALPPDAVVIDVGANIGGYALLLAHARPDIRILMVEPDPAMVARLRCNMALNAMQGRCRVLSVAITGGPGEVVLDIDRVNRGRSHISDGIPGHEQVRVPGITLAMLLDEGNIPCPDLIKLDMEGHEPVALESLFRDCPPRRWPRFLQIEQYRDLADNAAVRLAQDHGYRIALRSRMNLILHREAGHDEETV